MDVPDDTTEFDVDDMPPGYILVRQEDGMYSFVKLEPQEQEEIIEEVENIEIEEAEVEQEEEVIDESVRKNLLRVDRRYLALPDEETLDELEIDDIPDIIEEELSPGSVDQTISDAQIAFVDASVDPEFGTLPVKDSAEKKPKKPPPYGPVTWKGLTIPAGLTPEEVERFKGKHNLIKLLEQVKRNKCKVEIYSKKNEELKRLIGNQREQMMKMGFPLKDIARFHCSKRRSRAFPRPLSPEINESLVRGTDRLAYKAKRLQAEYGFYRKCLKAILSSHRRYKKIFVENHEKLRKGPSGKSLSFQASAMQLMKRAVLQVAQQASDDGSDSEQSDFQDEKPPKTMQYISSTSGDFQDDKPPKTFKCYHCSYSAASKSALVPHIKNHFIPPKTYNCPECPYKNFKVTQFLEHMKLHPGAKAFLCDHCDFKTAHPSALKNHKSLHMAVKPFKCPMCTLRFGRSDHLRNHMRCHSSKRSYKCELCPYSSKYASGLSNHIRRLHKALYLERKTGSKDHRTMKEADDSEDPGETTEIEVDETGKISSIRTIRKNAKEGSDSDDSQRRASLRRTVKRKVLEDFTDGEEFDEMLIKTETVTDEHGNVVLAEGFEESEGEVVEDEAERDYETDAEDARGTYYEDLGEEDEDEDEGGGGGGGGGGEEEEEDEEVVYSAPAIIAKKENSNRKDLLSSYVIYQCVWCDFSCEMKSALLDHSRTHMLSWIFTCKACGFEAKTPSDLQIHTEDHKNAGEFDCPYCDYTTENKLKLKGHVEKRHPAGKPMSCIYCEFISSSRQAMKSHMTTHKAKKMWKCMICDYKAPFRSSLKRHLRKHTGERPYYCPHCKFNAAQYSHLTRHLRKYHPDVPSLLENRPPSPFVAIF